MTGSRCLKTTSVLLAVVGPLLVAAAAAATTAATTVLPVGGASGGARPPSLLDRLRVSSRFIQEEVDTCAGVVTRGPVQCPCDLSMTVETAGFTTNLSWALQATVSRGGHEVEILRIPRVTATQEVPSSGGKYASPVQYHSIEQAGPVSFRLSLIAGSSIAECHDATVAVGMEPKPASCPVRNVSPGGKGRVVRAPPTTAARLLVGGDINNNNATLVTPAGAGAPVARIVGGRPAQMPAEKALLARLLQDGRISCTGAFYPPYHVVTAAHCSVALGATVQVFPPNGGGSGVPAVLNMTVTTAANHPVYEIAPTYVLNDVAVLTLRPPEGTSSEAIGAIPWPRLVLNADAAVPAEGDAVRAAGFGLVVDAGFPSDGALFVDQPALTPREAAAYKRDVQDPRNYPNGRDGPIPPGEALDHPALLCTAVWEGDCSTCQGDSGGPLYQVVPPKKDTPRREPTYVQVGVTSYGEGCGRPDTVDVTVRVSTMKKWIEWQMRAAPGGTAGAKRAASSPGRSVSA